MLKPTESPPASLQPRFAASITPGPPPGDDGESRLGEDPRGRARLPVGLAVLAHSGRAEDRDRRPVDLEHLLEAAEELRRDHRHVVREIFVRSLENAPVVHQSRFCSTCVATIPSTSRTTRPV